MKYTNLNGTTLLIGKEPEKGCLLVAVCRNGHIVRAFTMGSAMSLPASVSRCLPQQGVAHCKVDIDTQGMMTMTNLKWQNVTYVDGTDIQMPVIINEYYKRIELGRDRYQLNLNALLATASKMIGGNGGNGGGSGPEQPEFSIAFLKRVWDDYDRQLMELQMAERKKANMSRLGGILSMLGMLLAVLPSMTDKVNIPDWVRFSMIGLALIIGIYTFVSSIRASDSFAVKKHKLDDQLYVRYVCPNPKCHHFMGMQPFVVIRQNKVCPYCRCKYSKD